MRSQVVLKLLGPLDQLHLVWQVGETMLASVAFADDPEGTRYHVLLALQEMVTNVLRHAYDQDETRPIELCFETSADDFEVTLRDQGPAFDPLAHDSSAIVSGSQMPKESGGFGIPILRKCMDEVSYERRDGWNQLRMRKHARTPVLVR
ncbi:MAG: ATP-binding protein [Planctomycetota bacterium]|jgi:anti-sigma regulatory factor (Ser/Thr protein kinase)|nr:ATP-binding protein [Planctomycetota bacterium]MSR39869.1 ATP-binding protein [Planctomycetota bacterium]